MDAAWVSEVRTKQGKIGCFGGSFFCVGFMRPRPLGHGPQEGLQLLSASRKLAFGRIDVHTKHFCNFLVAVAIHQVKLNHRAVPLGQSRHGRLDFSHREICLFRGFHVPWGDQHFFHITVVLVLQVPSVMRDGGVDSDPADPTFKTLEFCELAEVLEHLDPTFLGHI